MGPEVSIVIRARNEGASIGRCLQMVYEQNTRYQFEVIVIDSGSSDDTLEVCRKYPVITHEIPPSEFNFGRALNLGGDLARGRYMVALTAHAYPANDKWLDPLVASLENDDAIAGAYSRQIPKPGCIPFEAVALNKTFGDTPFVVSTPPLRARDVVFSNASSCLRKDVITRTPFRDLPYAEDRDWAKRVLDRGHKIAYVPDSSVYHSHNRNLRQRYQVAKRSGRAFFEMDGEQTPVKAVLRFVFPPSIWRMYNRYHAALRRLGLKGVDLHRGTMLSIAYSFVGHCGEFTGSRFGISR
jgi:rhamnosyltransferase